MIRLAGGAELDDSSVIDVCTLLRELEAMDHRPAPIGVDALAVGRANALSRGTVQRRGVNLTTGEYTREMARGADRVSETGEQARSRVLSELARLLNVSPGDAVGKARRVRKVAINRGLYRLRT